MGQKTKKMEIIDAACCQRCIHYKCQDLSLMRYKVDAACKKGYWQDIFYGDGDYAEDFTEQYMCEEFERKIEIIENKAKVSLTGADNSYSIRQ